jgi:hypothetical protein
MTSIFDNISPVCDGRRSAQNLRIARIRREIGARTRSSALRWACSRRCHQLQAAEEVDNSAVQQIPDSFAAELLNVQTHHHEDQAQLQACYAKLASIEDEMAASIKECENARIVDIWSTVQNYYLNRSLNRSSPSLSSILLELGLKVISLAQSRATHAFVMRRPFKS